MFRNDTPEGRRQVSLACKERSFHKFVPGQKIEMFLVREGWKLAGVVQDWGSYFDDQQHVPDDWIDRVPVQLLWQRVTISFPERGLRPHVPPERNPDCNKLACARLRCAGPDWCRCKCDHWWIKI